MKNDIIKEIQQMQNLGMCIKLDTVSKINEGMYNQEIEEMKSETASHVADHIIQLDMIRTRR